MEHLSIGSSKASRLLYLDADELFASKLKKYARINGFELVVCKDLEALGSLGEVANYAAVFIGDSFKPIRPKDMAKYLHILFPNTPLIKVLSETCAHRSELGKFVKGFILKDAGPERVLQTAIECLGYQSIDHAKKLYHHLLVTQPSLNSSAI